MKSSKSIDRHNSLFNFGCLAIATLLIASLSSCSELSMNEKYESQFSNKYKDEDTVVSLWQTLRNPESTDEQRLTALQFLANSPSRLHVARLIFDALSEPEVHTLINTPGPLNFTGKDFTGFDLAGVGFYAVDLNGTNLSNSNLSDSNFFLTNLSWANLSGANLARANLANANLSGANLTNANLSDAYMFNVDLTGADLSGANLTGSQSLNDSRLNEACGNDKTILPTGFSIPVCSAGK